MIKLIKDMAELINKNFIYSNEKILIIKNEF
jgi:hypothetical protein